MAVVVYFQGDLDAARKAAPKGKVRFANAKFFRRDDPEYKAVNKVPHRGMVPVMFEGVLISSGVRDPEAIEETYRALGVEVSRLDTRAAAEPPPPVKAKAKTPRDMGWTLKSAPADYLKRNPKGARAELAKKIVEALGS